MLNDKKVLLIGSYSNGGISSVIDQFLKNNLSEYVDFYPSYIEAPTWLNWLRFFALFPNFCFKFSNKNYKIVHLLTANKGSIIRKLLLLFAAKLFGKKVIVNFHSGTSDVFYNDSFFPVRILLKLFLNMSDMIIVLSSQWQKNIGNKCDNTNIQVLYNPVEIKNIAARDSKEINVLFMGRMGERKGAFDLIEAAKLINNPNVKINMYGDGEVSKIKKLVEDNNLENIVKVNGWISSSEVDQVYNKADIVILPSYNEGLPMTLLEASAYGLPIISTPVGGIPDIVTEGKNGFLISPGNYKSMAEKIEILANNKELRTSMGQKSYEIACEKFDVNIIISNLKSLYDSML